MRDVYDALRQHALNNPHKLVFSDNDDRLSREELLSRAGALRRELPPSVNTIGILAANGVRWAVAQTMGAAGGKTVVPLPSFFSSEQLGHIVRDANIDLILCSEDLRPLTASSGIATQAIEGKGNARPIEFIEGFRQIIYTSGSTGHPKGVRLGGCQMGWSTKALAAASAASVEDFYLSIVPLALLLETICAIFVPLLVGGRAHFSDLAAKAFGAGQMSSIATSFECARPTSSVLAPQLLAAWVQELAVAGKHAPETLRFVAVGGAPAPEGLVESAWALGIPVYEGYGLSECCSVVALNRPGARKKGTVGRPLPGLKVWIDEGEIVVEGPSVMDGYLGVRDVKHQWRTGDLGAFDPDGYLTVHGRKDHLLVTSFGRNVSPEWIETQLLADRRVALCAVFGHGDPHLTALLVPSAAGNDWLLHAERAEIQEFIAGRCSKAPAYAVPKDFVVLTQHEIMRLGFLTSNGRWRRKQIAAHFKKPSNSATYEIGNGP
jgi:long-subunit acyl-CoA synthetase (AMP-forming)